MNALAPSQSPVKRRPVVATHIVKRWPVVANLIVAIFIAALTVGMRDATAAEVKIACATDRTWLKPGVPAAVIVTFDEDLKTAQLFASELGGVMKGDAVDITRENILFRFTAGTGGSGRILVSRVTGALMLNVSGPPAMELVASCRAQTQLF